MSMFVFREYIFPYVGHFASEALAMFHRPDSPGRTRGRLRDGDTFLSFHIRDVKVGQAFGKNGWNCQIEHLSNVQNPVDIPF